MQEGSQARITATFVRDGQPIEPTAVSGEATAPDGNVIKLSVTPLGGGEYMVLVELTMPGTWWVRVMGDKAAKRIPIVVG